MDEVLSQVERWTGQGGWIMQVFLVIFGAVLLKVLQIIESNGAEAAFPTSTLHIPEGIVLGAEK